MNLRRSKIESCRYCLYIGQYLTNKEYFCLKDREKLFNVKNRHLPDGYICDDFKDDRKEENDEGLGKDTNK